MADKEAVELSLGLDSKKFDAGLAKTKQKTEQAADGMGKAFGKFGFEMDGVLTKLARQLSVTDIAAAAVFSGIAKGQQVIAQSQAAWLAHEKAARLAGEAYSVVLTQIDMMDARMREHNESIGTATAAWLLLSKTVEERFSSALNTAVELLAIIDKSPFAKALLRGMGSVGSMLSGAATFIGGAANAASGAGSMAFVGPQVPDNLGEIRASQDAAARAREDMQRRILESERSFRFSLPGGDMPEFGRNRRSFMGGGGFAEGATSDLGGTMEELERQRIEYEKGLDSQAAAMERANEQLTAFSNNIGYGLVNALFQGQNAVDALKNAVMSMVQDFLGQLVSGGIKSIVGSIIPGFGALSTGGGGRTVGTSPSPQALEFYRGVVAPAMAYEQRRGR